MSASSRFEIRCTPEIRELVDVLRAIEGDTTFSQMFRRLVVNHARDLAGPSASLTVPERLSVRKALSKVSEAS